MTTHAESTPTMATPGHGNTATVRRTHGEPNTPARGIALDLVYDTRGPEPCAICGQVMPAVDKPLYELETTDCRPLCRPCARTVAPEISGAVAFLTTIARAFDAGRGEQCRDALAAVLSGVSLYYEAHGLEMPTDTPQTPRRPRTAPARRRRRR